MDVSECDRLDDYLAGGLREEERAGFQAHLAGCPACRREIEQQREVHLLLARATRQLEPAPAPLIDRIEGQVRRSDRRRAVRWSLGLSAAAAVVLALWIGFATGQFGPRPEPPPVVQQPRQPPIDQARQVPLAVDQMPQTETPVRVTAADPSRAILRPVPTQTPNVSIVWVYPTIGPAPAPDAPAND